LTGVGQTTGTTINWNNVAQRPGTSSYASARNSRFDEVHLVVIDSEGKITGNSGSIGGMSRSSSIDTTYDTQYANA